MRITAMIEFCKDSRNKQEPSEQFNDWFEEAWGDNPEDHFRVIQVILLPETEDLTQGILVVYEYESVNP